MLKRIKYVSRQAQALSDVEVDLLVRLAADANHRSDITGALVVADRVFFQVLEGPSAAVDSLFERIRRDARHADVVCVGVQTNCEIRLFPSWAMRRIRPEATPAAREMERLVRELPTSPQTDALANELAGLMRSSLRAA